MAYIRHSQRYLAQGKYLFFISSRYLFGSKKKRFLRDSILKNCHFKNRILTQAWCPLKHRDT